MCNLYATKKSAAEIARLFHVEPPHNLNFAEQVYPGYSGLVIADGDVRSMIWGFPFQQTSKKTGKLLKPKPVNNTRTDKLDTFFWRYSFEERRCLIPVSAFAEAEGPRGAMTRTWITLPGEEVFTVAGIWRDSEEWGACYSMLMTEANEQISTVHNRMPVILDSVSERAQWLEGTPRQAKEVCVPFKGELSIERTEERWAK